MNDNTKLEIAVEIMAATIAMYSKKGYDIDSEEMQTLAKEREEMYKGNAEVIDKIINVYGKVIKDNYNKNMSEEI